MAKTPKPKKTNRKDPLVLARGDVAKILNVSPLTVANREKTGRYPEAARSENGYRVYTLEEIFELQIITYGRVAVGPIVTVAYDRGWTDVDVLNGQVSHAMDEVRRVRIEAVEHKEVASE